MGPILGSWLSLDVYPLSQIASWVTLFPLDLRKCWRLSLSKPLASPCDKLRVCMSYLIYELEQYLRAGAVSTS